MRRQERGARSEERGSSAHAAPAAGQGNRSDAMHDPAPDGNPTYPAPAMPDDRAAKSADGDESTRSSLLAPRSPAAWQAAGLTVRYAGAEREALDGVSIEVPAGSFTAVLGPNGSGKSTLLRTLLGVLKPQAGEARFQGRPVSKWARDAMAREVGVVPQGEEDAFPMTVREMVAMGRYPHLGAWRREGAHDRAAIATAMRQCDVEEFAARPIDTLSGGERQRARLARALAQEPHALALDEPTTALDVAHEMAIFELLRGLGRDGATILIVTHNLNLAARYADRLVLLDEGRVAAIGAPAEVLTAELIQRVYRWPVRIVEHPGPGPDAGAPQVVPLAGEACGAVPEGYDPPGSTRADDHGRDRLSSHKNDSTNTSIR
jgi:iron complex transport system ATP-binding protein